MEAAQASARRDDATLARAAVLLDQYSMQLTSVVEEVLGEGASGNREVALLVHLLDHPACRPNELMDVTGASRPSLAAVLGRLERRGLVARTYGRQDRRTRFTSLTPAGRRRLAALDAALGSHFHESEALVKEIVALLEGPAAPGRPDGAPSTALGVAQRLAAAGQPYAEELDRSVGVLGRRQRLALGTLLMWGSARPTQLAEVLGLTSGGLTYLMDQFEADGIVERVSGSVDDDRRAVVISLGERGRLAGEAMCRALERHAEPIVEALVATLALGRPG